MERSSWPPPDIESEHSSHAPQTHTRKTHERARTHGLSHRSYQNSKFGNSYRKNCEGMMRTEKIKLRSVVVGMSLAGKSARAISRELHISKSTVVFWLSKFQASNDVENDANSGRPKDASSTADCRLNRFFTCGEPLCLFFNGSWRME